MAKKNQTQAVEVASTAKKVLKVTSTAKKPLKVSSTAKKTSEVASTSKKPMKENVSTAKKKNKQSEPPESSKDDEEEESDSSSDEEDEPTKNNKKNQEIPPASSESESEAESESGSEPEATKTTPPATVSTSASPNKKRQSEEAASTVVKRAKKCLKSHINGQEAVKSPSTAKKASESKKPLKQNVSTSKKKNKRSEPPESSTDDKEEESDSSSDEEDEPTKNNKKNQETPPAASESESEAESETEAASTKTQPPGTVSTSASPNKKRQSEEAASTETAKKKGTFERVWTENDEIVLLQGMIDYKNETGESPYENMRGFYQMVKKSISFDVKSGKQFSSKIWALKNKYVGKRKNGVEPSFTKPHDLRCLELAKTIWKTDVDSTLVKKIKMEDDSLKIDGMKLQEGWFERSFLVRVINDLGVLLDEETVKEKWSLVPVETKKRLEEKVMSLQASQLECVLQKTDLLNEVSHVIAKVDD